jgi:hypothetical protein
LKKSKKDTQLGFYKVMAVQQLLYGSGMWDMSTEQEEEMTFLRTVRSCDR